MEKGYYIRNRIYVNYAKKANRNYPRRLYKNLENLHKNIKQQGPIISSQNQDGIRSKTFIPKTYNHIGPKYYWLIAHLSDYFECLTIWETTMVKGSIKPLEIYTIDMNLSNLDTHGTKID